MGGWRGLENRRVLLFPVLLGLMLLAVLGVNARVCVIQILRT